MKTVLVIDSDEGRRSLVTALQGAGFRVMEEVESGNAMRRVAKEHPGAIIMDEDMPPIEGIELLPFLRSFTDSLIVVKGSGGGPVAAQALLQGADVYLVRSVSVREVLARVHALSRRWAIAREESFTKKGRLAGNGFDRELSLLT